MSSVTIYDRRKKASNKGVDRISDLPESILIDILSLLPTHLAVQTSLLSTKWKFLWKNIYNLCFNDKKGRLIIERKYRYSPAFAFLVNKVLTSLNKQSIKKFSLCIYKNNEQYDVSSWISTAISKNAKVIEFVEDNLDDDSEMPGSLYTCKTLEVLRLRTYNLILPSLISLPNLKTLDLEVSIRDPVSKLVSGCLSLENLVISGLSVNVLTFTISSPTLRSLSLKDFEDMFNFIEEDEDDIINTKIVINAPQLRYLNLDFVETRSFSVENHLCLLDEARIFLYFNKFHEPLIYDRYSKAVLNLFQGLYNVKTLSLGEDTFQVLSHGGVIPRFSRLSKLTVEVRIHLKSLINLLESCNELQSLTLSLDRHYCEEVTCWSEPENVPICFLSSLHTISMHGVKDHGFEMIVYMLQNAKVLRSMEIQPYDFKTKVKLLERILNVPRGCGKCQVIFLNPMKKEE